MEEELTPYGNLSETELKLLEKNILEIVGQINEEMMMRIREAMTMLELNGSPDIEIVFLSNGGGAGAALSIYSFLKRYEGKKSCKINYICSSACPIIFQACDSRKIERSAAMIIHGVTSLVKSWQWEDEGEIQKIKVQDLMLQKMFFEILESRSKLSQDDIRKMMKDETEILSEMAIGFGLADEIF